MAKRSVREDYRLLESAPAVQPVVEPRTATWLPGDRPMCQSRSARGHWKGYPCGNLAGFQVGPEVACHTHIGQALERNPGATVAKLGAK